MTSRTGLFTGQYKSPKNVSMTLGQSNDANDANLDDFIQRQKLDREARRLEREKENAMLTVANRIRWRLQMNAIKNDLRCTYDYDIKNYTKGTQLLPMIRQLACFYTIKVDDSRASWLFNRLQLNDDSDLRSYWSLIDDNDARFQWLLITRQMVTIAFSLLERNACGENTMVLLVPMLQRLLNPINWPISKADQQYLSSHLFKSLEKKLNYFTTLRRLYEKDLKNYIVLPLLLFPLHCQNAALTYSFIMNFLSIPNVFTQLSESNISVILRDISIDSLVDFFENCDSVISDELMKERYVLWENLFSLFAHQVLKCQEIKTVLVTMLSVLLESMSISLMKMLYCSPAKETSSFFGSEDEDEITFHSDQKDVMQCRSTSFFSMMSRASHILLNVSFWKVLLVNSEKPNFQVYHFIAQILIYFPHLKSQILNILSFGIETSVPRWIYVDYLNDLRIVNYVQSFQACHQHYVLTGIYPDFFEKCPTDFWPIVYLLLSVLSQQLFITGDDDLIENCFALTLDELGDIAKRMEVIVVALICKNLDKSDQKNGLMISLLQKAMIKYVQHIHDRDARLKRFDAGFWHLSHSMDISDLEETYLEKIADEQDYVMHGTLSKKERQEILLLRLLREIPFCLPFQMRVRLFRRLIQRDRMKVGADDFFRSASNVVIRRKHAFEDGYRGLNHLSSQLKRRVKISFVSDLGIEEVGIDGGGVFKEFLNELAREVFNEDYGLFNTTPIRSIYPNPSILVINEDASSHFTFLGRIIGKAMYESVLMDVPFAVFFLGKLLGKTNYVDDLPSLDPELYRNLLFLKRYEGNVDDFSLSFSINRNCFGEAQTIDLIPDGRNIPVTNENRIRYIYLMAHYKLNKEIESPSKAFLKGFSDIIHPRWLEMFDQQELYVLISGATIPIDLEDLRVNTAYSGGYSDDHPTIRLFWSVLSDFSQNNRASFLKFVTSCSRPPLLGFKELRPSFCIHSSGSDEERLPSSSTCMNLLKLPEYSVEKTLREKLLYSIESGAGFELS